MANIPERQQITPEDFKKDEQALASKIAEPFNTYVEQLNEILDRNLTFNDNFRGVIKTLNYTAGNSLKFRYNTNERPIGLWIVNYSNLDDPTDVLPVAVQAQWSFDGQGSISLNNITGLNTGETYSITLIAISS